MTEEEHDAEFEVMMSKKPLADFLYEKSVSKVGVVSLANDSRYVKCPRCWHYHTIKLNYDCLCDRCSDVILDAHLDHPSVPFINACRDTQRRNFSV